MIVATSGLAAPFVGLGALGAVAFIPVITNGLSTIATTGVVSNLTEAEKSKKRMKN